MKNIYVIFILLAGILLAGCATTQNIQPEAYSPDSTAKIKIFRPTALWGAALRAPIYVNDKYIGKISNGGELTWVVHPGMVTVSTSKGTAAIVLEKKAPHAVSFKAEKGKTYHFKVVNPYQIQFTAPFYGHAAFQLQRVDD